jgi:hypothetical protein
MINRYFIDGKDLYSDYGITVLRSNGEEDFPKPKERLEVNWPDEHGLDVDEGVTLFEPREITLECLMQQASPSQAQAKLKSFRTLKSYKTSPLVHLVQLVDTVRPERFDGGKIHLFKLRLREAEPINKQYDITVPLGVDLSKFSVKVGVGSDPSATAKISWGDGSRDMATHLNHEVHFYDQDGLTYRLVVSADFSRTNLGVEVHNDGFVTYPVEL